VAAYTGVRYLREDYPGLNRARNQALREAGHAIVLFTDDDAVPDPAWLRAHLRAYGDPRVMCTTGLTMPLELETRAQETFEQYNPFARGFARKVYTRLNLNPLAVGEVGAGVNMAFRREVLAAVGPFDEALDAGTPTHSGGEAEMFSRILASGYRIVYEPGALSWHRHRRTWEELRRAIYGYGVGIYAFWTRKYFYDGELTAPLLALRWFWHDQLPALLRASLRRPDAQPFDLIAAELKGCVAGPFAYFGSRKQLSNRTARGS
jgi:GT2 family glycosyltransferase